MRNKCSYLFHVGIFKPVVRFTLVVHLKNSGKRFQDRRRLELTLFSMV